MKVIIKYKIMMLFSEIAIFILNIICFPFIIIAVLFDMKYNKDSNNPIKYVKLFLCFIASFCDTVQSEIYWYVTKEIEDYKNKLDY